MSISQFPGEKKYTDYQLREGLREGNQFIAITPPLWKLFRSFYGGSAVERRHIKTFGLNTRIELYFTEIAVILLKVDRRDGNGSIFSPIGTMLEERETPIKAIKSRI